jgi:hypothetical protein
MSKAANSQRWFSGWRKAARPDASDAADHGTAFGLEMSLPDMVPPAAPPKTDGTLPRKAGWMRRLTPRAKTLA